MARFAEVERPPLEASNSASPINPAGSTALRVCRPNWLPSIGRLRRRRQRGLAVDHPRRSGGPAGAAQDALRPVQDPRQRRLREGTRQCAGVLLMAEVAADIKLLVGPCECPSTIRISPYIGGSARRLAAEFTIISGKVRTRRSLIGNRLHHVAAPARPAARGRRRPPTSDLRQTSPIRSRTRDSATSSVEEHRDTAGGSASGTGLASPHRLS